MKKLQLTAVAGLVAVAAVGGTFAYFNQTAVAENPFDTGKYGTTVVEKFNPADGNQWMPGVTVDKDVTVQNTGDQPVVVRIKLDETWTRKDATTPYKTIDGVDDANEKNVYDSKDSQKDVADGQVADDNTVVTKDINTNDWTLGEDGWYYYNTVLAGGATTKKFLDDVTLLAEADMGKMEITYAYEIYPERDVEPTVKAEDYVDAETNKLDLEALAAALDLEENEDLYTSTQVAPKADALGYSDSNYVLTITTQIVQATDKAVEDAFSTAPELDWELKAEEI